MNKLTLSSLKNLQSKHRELILLHLVDQYETESNVEASVFLECLSFRTSVLRSEQDFHEWHTNLESIGRYCRLEDRL